MASSKEYLQFVLEQLSELQEVNPKTNCFVCMDMKM